MNKATKYLENITFPTPCKTLSEIETQHVLAKIRSLLTAQNAVLIAHYYTPAVVQMLAESTGGFVGDSLEMAKFGQRHRAKTLVIAGVRFMGETAKILSPEKQIVMPSLQAECSLDLGCPPEALAAFRAQYPDHQLVVYANTSAAVKAQADWVVTSSIALDIIEHLDAKGEKILWAPDRHLGAYLEKKTGAQMVHWQGACIVHDEFKARGLAELKGKYPQAAVLVHPESPQSVIAQADVVGSTSQLLKAAQQLPHKQLIIGTDQGICYKIQRACPDKELIPAPTGGPGATCRSCAHCPWMAMNAPQRVADALETVTGHVVEVNEDLRLQALRPLQRMLDFAHQWQSS